MDNAAAQDYAAATISATDWAASLSAGDLIDYEDLPGAETGDDRALHAAQAALRARGLTLADWGGGYEVEVLS